jgi:hypothetical protein
MCVNPAGVDQNPYQAPDPAGLPKRKNDSLDPLQQMGVYLLATAIVVAFILFQYGFRLFNAWLLGD